MCVPFFAAMHVPISKVSCDPLMIINHAYLMTTYWAASSMLNNGRHKYAALTLVDRPMAGRPSRGQAGQCSATALEQAALQQPIGVCTDTHVHQLKAAGGIQIMLTAIT